MHAMPRAVTSIPGQERVARAPFGARIVIHALAAETGGVFGSWDNFIPPGKGPSPHTHSRETEIFRVIRGRFRFTCGADSFDAPVGAVVVLPPHVQHGWINISDEPGQMMAVVSPGGFEQMFIDIAESGAATLADIARIEARYGIANDETRRLGLG